MLILGLTDIHGATDGFDSFPEVDLVIVAGDITHFGSRRDAEEVLNSLRCRNIPLLAVPGNCDGADVSNYLEEKGLSLDGKTRSLDGLTVYGMGGAMPGPASTPREIGEEEYERRFAALENSGDLRGGILVCHQPPYKTQLDRVMGFRHVGSRAVRSFIERAQPILCLTGHIHESAGIDRLGHTTVINPGPFRHGKYTLCRVENGSVSCTMEKI